MAMGPELGQGATLQLEMVSVDQLVPEDDLYRRIDALVDWGFVRPAASSYYAEALGRPSLDPVVLCKLMLAGALEGIGSMRELLRVCSLRVDLRRFLGYGLGERLPVHQTVSDAHSRRFLDGALFESLFARTVSLCREHGLLEGTHLSIDGFHLEANAALESLRASLRSLGAAEETLAASATASQSETSPQPASEKAPRQDVGPGSSEPDAILRLAGPGMAPAPARPSPLNERLRSESDPDARFRRKPGERPHLVYRGQLAVDPGRRCVVACLAERADGFEGDGLEPLLDRARFHLPGLLSFGADSGYAAERVWEEAERRKLEAFLPPQRHMLPDPKRPPRTRSEELAGEARLRCRSSSGRLAARRRLADAEGVIGEAKLRHTLSRARCRGLPLVQIQLKLACAAINLKRLAAHKGDAASAAAAASGGRTQEAGALQVAADGRSRRRNTPRGTAERSSTPTLAWTVTICLN